MRTLEQEAARREKQRATALMTKCPCGNVAAQGQSLCKRCELKNNSTNALVDETERCYSALRKELVGLFGPDQGSYLVIRIADLIDARIKEAAHERS